MIAILDYDMGNVAAIRNILKSVGVNDTIITNKHDCINSADKIRLPGVGAFDTGVKKLKQYDLVGPLNEAKEKGKHILGICMGMQLLGRASEEGDLEGLDFIPFDCQKFPQSDIYKVPHMGWDTVKINPQCKLTNMKDREFRYYFCHSYYAKCDDIENEIMSCTYGIDFCAGVELGNIYGVQFHPEKSHRYGKILFKRFSEL